MANESFLFRAWTFFQSCYMFQNQSNIPRIFIRPSVVFHLLRCQNIFHIKLMMLLTFHHIFCNIFLVVSPFKLTASRNSSVAFISLLKPLIHTISWDISTIFFVLSKPREKRRKVLHQFQTFCECRRRWQELYVAQFDMRLMCQKLFIVFGAIFSAAASILLYICHPKSVSFFDSNPRYAQAENLQLR